MCNVAFMQYRIMWDGFQFMFSCAHMRITYIRMNICTYHIIMHIYIRMHVLYVYVYIQSLQFFPDQ